MDSQPKHHPDKTEKTTMVIIQDNFGNDSNPKPNDKKAKPAQFLVAV
jgi:hypothetical protein